MGSLPAVRSSANYFSTLGFALPMNPYLSETDYAIQNLLLLATNEEAQLAEKLSALTSTEAKLRVYQWDFESSDLNDDFSEAHVMAAFGRMANAAKETESLRREASELQALVGIRQAAIQAICGAILQIAKQGISVVHGELSAAPTGRMIGSAGVRDIIWQGRNQYEEGKPKPGVLGLFATLEKEQGTQFSLTHHASQNRAAQVVQLLGWTTYTAYLSDMSMILH